MDSLIRWKKGDYIRLGQAVSRFNRIVGNLESEIDNLPELKNYKELRENIYSRKELNRILNSLRRVSEKSLKETKILESGEKISQYEWKEIGLARKRALFNLQKERERILSSRPSIGMGEERLSEIKAIEESFKDIGKRSGSDLKRITERIFHLGRSDYNLSKDKQFMENFYKALEGISNFQNYEILKKELDKIKNPSKFYEYVNKSPVLMDLFLWYKEADSTFYGGFMDNQEAFTFTLLYHLGIENIRT